MPVRPVALAIAALTSCAAVYLLFSSSPSAGAMMTSPPDFATDSSARAPSTDDFSVSLIVPEERTAPAVAVTIENSNPKHPLTFLRWDSPFDPASLNSGVFAIHDISSGAKLPSPELKMSRLLPPSQDDLVEVPASGSVTETLELKAPWIPGDGRLVSVQLEGEWKAVWPRAKADVGEEDLGTIAGEDVLKGSFQSRQPVQLKLSA